MGGAASTIAETEAAKPLDGADLQDFEAAKAEVIRLRTLAANQLAAEQQATEAVIENQRRNSTGSAPRRGSNASTASRRGSNASRRDSNVSQVPLPAFEGDAAQLERAVKEVYVGYCSYGAGRTSSGNVTMELDGAKFAKFAKECGFVDKKLRTTNVDLIFTKVKAKGMKKIGFEGFIAALQQIAEHKGEPMESVLQQVAVSGGPKSNATKAEYNRFYDDKSTYGQGVHAHGGPSTNDHKITLSNLTDRDNKADVRGAVNPDEITEK